MQRLRMGSDQPTALQDIVLCMAAGFFILFILAFLVMNPIADKGNVKNKAEFLITVTWSENQDDDVDIWVKDPNDILTWYRDKSPANSLVHLERDDLGDVSDKIVIDGRVVTVPLNEERITIRGIVPGEYVVNLHLYNKKSKEPFVSAKVKVEKLNPTSTIVYSTPKPIILYEIGDEVTVVRFTILPDGSVTNIRTEPQISLLEYR